MLIGFEGVFAMENLTYGYDWSRWFHRASAWFDVVLEEWLDVLFSSRLFCVYERWLRVCSSGYMYSYSMKTVNAMACRELCQTSRF